MSEPSLQHWILAGASVPPAHRLVGLDPLAKALLIQTTSARSKKPILAVFADKLAARDAVDNLKYFAPTGDTVHYIPPVEFDFHRGVLPSAEDIALRNLGLHQCLGHPDGQIFVTTVAAVLQKCLPRSVFKKASLTISPNDELDRDELIEKLTHAGYKRQPVAYDPGIFSIRGGLVDVFSPAHSKPVRIEFYGDLVEELRFFDAESQRSLEPIEKAHIIPVGQIVLPQGKTVEEISASIKERLDSIGIQKTEREQVIEHILASKFSGSMGFLFPEVCGGSESLLDYLPGDKITFWDGEELIKDAAFEREIPRLQHNHQLYEKELSPIGELSKLFLSENEFRAVFELDDRAFLFETFQKGLPNEMSLFCEPVSLATERQRSKGAQAKGHLEPIAKRLREWRERGFRVHLVSHTTTHAERIQMLLDPYGISCHVHADGERVFPGFLESDSEHLHCWQGFITRSTLYPSLKLVILSEEEIFGRKKRTAKTKKHSSTSTAKSLAAFRNMKAGDYLVHSEHGIGKYRGLNSMTFQGITSDYVILEYRDGDKLYIPIYRLNVLQKFAGEGTRVELDKLGGDRWVKVKKKAEKAVAEMAAEFLKTHAKRRLIPAPSFADVGPEYAEFEMAFPYDETPDQQGAIDDVSHDLSQTFPMDRLVVGDVGYGKTEVAMRAAYRSVLGGKQVAVLVPTTVLAFQHFQNFKERFKDTATKVESVSRLKKASENRETVAQFRDGKIDVIVGTHRLLSSDVIPKDLGLVIVDEEHRFGVAHKEKLKRFSESVHYLSMTATPIPRTLNMAMAGIKDISLITTPPPDRLSVRTFVSRRSEEVIVDAISTELGRGGQVFFVHNRVQTIMAIKDELKQLYPKARVEVVHGQMDPKDLERKMLGFHNNEFEILLTTAIIESGVDIPRVNTIIIDRADMFGLAQLYQLRGRVGRADKRAYCYLLVPGEKAITDDAKERLQVIQRHTDLGAGFNIASHDMEIRGAGDLLGKSQHGHLNAVGVDLYFELLEQAILELKGERSKLQVEPEINLRVPAYFPHEYLPDISERIVLYRRLSDVDSEDEIESVEEELRDRFGSPPEEVSNLLGVMRIKLYLKKMNVSHLNCGPKKTSLQFGKEAPIRTEVLIDLIQNQPGKYALTPDHKLVFTADSTNWKEMLGIIHELSDRLLE